VNEFEQTLLLVSVAAMTATTLVIVVVQYVRGRGRDH